MVEALQCARKHSDTTIRLVEIMSHKSSYPCFRANPAFAVEQFRTRHNVQADATADESQGTAVRMVKGFLAASYNHTGTWMYDQFQVLTNGIKA